MIEQQPTNYQSIQSPLELMIKNLFNDFLQDQQLRPIICLNSEKLVELFSQCSSYFHKNIQKKYKRILTFLANYHKIVHLYALQTHTPITNNIALHFINLLAYSRLKHNLIDEAKNIYKNVWTYVDIKSSDKLLLSIALNNLGYLHQKNKKHFKSLECHLKVVQLMGKRLGQLKKQNNKSQLIQDSVILISNLIHCQKTLKSIISNHQKQQKSFYHELFQYINEIGYKCSRKYLGQKSQFTKVFLDNHKNYQKLPVFLEQDKSLQRTSLEQKILQQLQGIYEVLKTKRQPEIVYVKEQKPLQQPIIPLKQQTQPIIQSSQSSIIQPPPQPIKYQQQEMQSSNKQSQTINGWNITLYFLRSKQVSQKIKIQQIYSQFVPGTLVIQCKKNKKQLKTMISPSRLQKILTLIDYQSSLLPDYTVKKMSDQQFFNLIIFSHIFIDDDGNLQFSTKKKSILKPIKFTFLEQQSLIFCHYLQRNTFRFNISPINGTQSLSIDMEFNENTLSKMFKIEQKSPRIILNTYEKIKRQLYKKQIQIPQIKTYQLTQVTLINQEQVQNTIEKILKDFQTFILEAQQQDKGNLKLSDYLNSIQNDEHNCISFFSFKETQWCPSIESKFQKKNPSTQLFVTGLFSVCKYLENISSIQVFSQNNYKTFDIESQSQAKGTLMIYPDKFEKQFGISIKTVQREGLIMSLLEMLCKRYQLKVFYSHLKTHDEQLYNQNAIYELPLTCKSYKRSVIKDENGEMIPVTISHLTLNNTIPLAFRIDIYFSCQGCAQNSILVKIRHNLWIKPDDIQQNQQKNQNEDNVENQADYQTNLILSKQKPQQSANKKDYFLSEWCQLQGYHLLLKHIKIQNMKIKFKGSLLKFFSLQKVLDHMISNEPQ